MANQPAHSIAVAGAPSLAPRHASTFARWSASEAKQVLDHAAGSGVSLNAYAALHGLNSSRLYWWRARLRGQSRTDTTASLRFVQVEAGPQSDAVWDVPSGVEVVVG